MALQIFTTLLQRDTLPAVISRELEHEGTMMPQPYPYLHDVVPEAYHFYTDTERAFKRQRTWQFTPPNQGMMQNSNFAPNTSFDWICSVCGFKNRAMNEVCGGKGPMGCKTPRELGDAGPPPMFNQPSPSFGQASWGPASKSESGQWQSPTVFAFDDGVEFEVPGLMSG